MSDVDEIRRQMAQIRHEMHHDVSSVVTEVGEAMDWRSPIRKHPYIALGVGLAVGYFLVPRRKSAHQVARQALAGAVPLISAAAVDASSRLRAPSPVAAAAPAAVEKPPRSLGRQLLGWLIGMLWPLVSQSAQAYAAMWLENQLKQQLNPNFKPPGEYVPPSSSGRPGETYGEGPAQRAGRRG